MTEDSGSFDVSRRKVLLGVGTVGVAAAGTGWGTSAYFNDEETLDDTEFTAGNLDLTVHAEATYYGAEAKRDSRKMKGGETTGFDLDDVKPGDTGEIEFCFEIDDNPSWLWMGGGLEGGRDLADALAAKLCYTYHDGSTVSVFRTDSLAGLLDELETGIPLDSRPARTGRSDFEPHDHPRAEKNPCVNLYLTFPTDLEDVNDLQGERVAFDVSFFAEQSRHNEDPDNPYAGGE